MTRRSAILVRAFVIATLLAVPVTAQDDEELKKDLTAVIALHGLPCGEVVAVKVNAENDYNATCKDGNRYRVYLNAQGRVMVDKQQ
jgi:hypothetical protein